MIRVKHMILVIEVVSPRLNDLLYMWIMMMVYSATHQCKSVASGSNYDLCSTMSFISDQSGWPSHVHSFIHSFYLCMHWTFILCAYHAFIHSSFHSFVCSFVRSLIHSLIIFICAYLPFIHSVVLLFIHSFHSFFHSFFLFVRVIHSFHT